MKNLATLFVIILLSSFVVFSQQKSETYLITKKLLETSNVNTSSDSLAKLFKIGDARVNDLIVALNDKDKNVALNAQRVIRYLGNTKGTKELYDWYGKQEIFTIAFSAIPLPINQREFDFAERRFEQSGKVLESRLGFDHIYPLLLDDSKQAKDLLERIINEMAKNEDGKYWVDRTRKIIKNNPRKAFAEDNNLANAVLKNAYFLHANEDKDTNVKLLSYNSNKDKALLILSNFGAIWHVVVEKTHEGWKFFSITQTSVS
jgi:hypothetical protein